MTKKTQNQRRKHTVLSVPSGKTTLGIKKKYWILKRKREKLLKNIYLFFPQHRMNQCRKEKLQLWRLVNEEKRLRMHLIPWNVTKLCGKKRACSFGSVKRNACQYFFPCMLQNRSLNLVEPTPIFAIPPRSSGFRGNSTASDLRTVGAAIEGREEKYQRLRTEVSFSFS